MIYFQFGYNLVKDIMFYCSICSYSIFFSVTNNPQELDESPTNYNTLHNKILIQFMTRKFKKHSSSAAKYVTIPCGILTKHTLLKFLLFPFFSQNSVCIMSKNIGIVFLLNSTSGIKVISRTGPTISGMNLISCEP